MVRTITGAGRLALVVRAGTSLPTALPASAAVVAIVAAERIARPG